MSGIRAAVRARHPASSRNCCGLCDVAAEDDDSARLNFLNQSARFGVELGAGKTDVEELSYLLFERERMKRIRWHFYNGKPRRQRR